MITMMIRVPNLDRMIKHPKYEPRFTNYTTLSTSRVEVYLATYQEAPYRKPRPIRKDRSQRHLNKYCRFPAIYVHNTNGCNHLKDEIKFLLWLGKLGKFKADKPQEGERDNNPGFKRQRLPPLEPEPVDFTLETIYGGPHLIGDSSKSRKNGSLVE